MKRINILLFFILFCGFMTVTMAQDSKIMGQSWAKIKQNKSKQGLLTVFHYDRRPFFYEGEMGQVTGIEHDVIHELCRYIQRKYDIQIFTEFKKFDNYEAFHEAIKNNTHPGVIGLSSMRIEQENTSGVKFSEPFMQGVEVLLTSNNLPIAQKKTQIKSILDDKTAITIKDSPFEIHVKQFMKQYYPNAKIVYVDTEEEIAERIAKESNLFGFAPLSDYYSQLKKGNNLGRQSYLSIPHQGYALTLPVETDWNSIVTEFFEDHSFQDIMNFIIKRHLGTDVTDLLWKKKEVTVSDEDYGKALDPISLKIALDAERNSNHFWRNVVLITSILLLVGTFLGIRYRKRKNRIVSTQNQQIAQQIAKLNELEDRYERTHGQTKDIQSVILAQKNTLEQLFPKSFVWFEPREHLSGDFYWITQMNGKKIAIVIDSTGQNATGALASVQLNLMLNQVIHQNKTTQPDKILAKMHKYLNETLRHESTRFLSEDGLVASVCAIDANNYVQYAGAGQPMYYTNKMFLHQFKPKKTPVGTTIFKTDDIVIHDIQLDQGDMLYLCSDGFQDQLSSNNKNKYMVKKFREFLFEISDLEESQQMEKLQHEFKNWRAGHKQTDDITIIGLRME